MNLIHLVSITDNLPEPLKNPTQAIVIIFFAIIGLIPLIFGVIKTVNGYKDKDFGEMAYGIGGAILGFLLIAGPTFWFALGSGTAKAIVP